MYLTMLTDTGRTVSGIDPNTHDMTVFWNVGWRIINEPQPSLEAANFLSEWLLKQRDYLSRQQPEPVQVLDDWESFRRSAVIHPGNLSSDRSGTHRASDGDSPKTPPTSSKGKNTFKQFIQRTTNTV